MDSPIIKTQKSHTKPYRKPLQPKNSPANPPQTPPKPLKPIPFDLSPTVQCGTGDRDKENRPIRTPPHPPTPPSPYDSSLAEELGAMRRRMERLRAEWEKTEELLRGRVLVMEGGIREIERRGEKQRCLEVEFRRVWALSRLRSASLVIKTEEENEPVPVIGNTETLAVKEVMIEN
ncbi:hypothetical protein QJS04_geneDACA005806 [Acorus gramineus]|uniref:Uncharacterized protein n=1 Tax=Acorus gramineus TaxID=55184 RepID=A0AAV9B2F0_ACOGR|nr:hypothetical protein QJS04_geneDACA005806 [Acorus gramineus]